MKINYKTPEVKVVVLATRRNIALVQNSAEAYGYYGTYNSDDYGESNNGEE